MHFAGIGVFGVCLRLYAFCLLFLASNLTPSLDAFDAYWHI